MKKNGKMLLGAVLVLTLLTGCKGKVMHPQAERETQMEGGQQIQTEMQIESGNQLESEYQMEAEYQAELDEKKQEKQAVKTKVEKAIGKSFDDDDWKYVDASECHTGYLNRLGYPSYEASVECYKDRDKIYVLYNSDTGKNYYYNDVCCSMDGGMTWSYTNLYRNSYTAMYFVNDTIIMEDGYHFFGGPIVVYSDWTNQFKELETNGYDKIGVLSEIFIDWCEVDVVFSDPDAKNNQITIQFYPRKERKHYLYEMTLNLNTMEKVSEDDPYDLTETGEAYAKTGYIYADSAEVYLDETELNVKYRRLVSLFGNTTSAEYEIRYAINEIYARKGYDFTDTEFEIYFSRKEWYHPIAGKQVTEEELNPYEKANIDLLVKIEKEVQAVMPDEA